MTSTVDKVILDMLNEQLRDKVISFAEYKQVLIELRSAANASVPAASTSPSVDNQGKKYTSKFKKEGDFVFEEEQAPLPKNKRTPSTVKLAAKGSKKKVAVQSDQESESDQ